ncbi:unnamed protein product [Protopolystoma xenopodis]|uniref:Uncharacterized protein n=1 Tax=Protopolystoma xenopodis TaxID=117903 RepID=A0A448WBE5_9PLAT|nr:unnamed protein product [Protopolystoma xenopodis]
MTVAPMICFRLPGLLQMPARSVLTLWAGGLADSRLLHAPPTDFRCPDVSRWPTPASRQASTTLLLLNPTGQSVAWLTVAPKEKATCESAKAHASPLTTKKDGVDEVNRSEKQCRSPEWTHSQASGHKEEQQQAYKGRAQSRKLKTKSNQQYYSRQSLYGTPLIDSPHYSQPLSEHDSRSSTIIRCLSPIIPIRPHPLLPIRFSNSAPMTGNFGSLKLGNQIKLSKSIDLKLCSRSSSVSSRLPLPVTLEHTKFVSIVDV